MKRLTYIATIASVVLFASCNKAEFEELYEQQDQQTEEKRTFVDPGEQTESLENAEDATPSLSSDNLRTDDDDKKKDIGISVKEVTDRDGEADGGDDDKVD